MGGSVARRSFGGVRLLQAFARSQSGNGIEQFAAVADQTDTEFFEMFAGEFGRRSGSIALSRNDSRKVGNDVA